MKPQTVRLGEVATIDRRGVSPQNIHSSTPYVGLEHIYREGGVQVSETVGSAAVTSTKFEFTSSHILYGKLRPYLSKIAIPSVSGVCSTDILPILVGPRIDSRYLLHFLRNPDQVARATQRSSGANLPRLSPKELEAFLVPIPSHLEQKRIVHILDAADALRAKRRESIAQLDALVQSTFLEMFGDPASNPTAWEVVSLGELMTAGPQNGLYRPSKDYGSGTRILRIDGFGSGQLKDVESLKRVAIDESTTEKYRLHAGEIVINRVNSRSHLGKSVLLPPMDEAVVFESNMMRIRLNDAKIVGEYAISCLQSADVKTQIQRAAKDAINQASVNQDDIKGLRLLCPPRSLQERYSRVFTFVEKLKTLERKHLADSNLLFASLQSRAFAGEL